MTNRIKFSEILKNTKKLQTYSVYYFDNNEIDECSYCALGVCFAETVLKNIKYPVCADFYDLKLDLMKEYPEISDMISISLINKILIEDYNLNEKEIQKKLLNDKFLDDISLFSLMIRLNDGLRLPFKSIGNILERLGY